MGKDLRSVYDNLGEIRVLLLLKLFFMVLIVIIIEISLIYIVKKFLMDDFILVKGLNNRMNMFYFVLKFEKYWDNVRLWKDGDGIYKLFLVNNLGFERKWYFCGVRYSFLF